MISIYIYIYMIIKATESQGNPLKKDRFFFFLANSTLAALVRALAQRETAVSGFSSLKKEIELFEREAKSSAFHLREEV